MRWFIGIMLCLYALPSLAADEGGGLVNLDEVLGVLAAEMERTAEASPAALLSGALDAAGREIASLTYALEGAPDKPRLRVWIGERLHERSLPHRAKIDEWGPWLVALRDFIVAALRPADPSPRLNALLADGLVRALDPHAALLSATAYGDFQNHASGHIGGLGLVFGRRDRGLVVESVLRGSPAALAGVHGGEQILQIGEHSALHLPLEDALNLIRGRVGTSVRLLLLPAGQAQPQERVLQRGDLRLASVEGRRLREGPREEIGYLRVRSFQDSTSSELQDHLNRFREGGPGLLGLVLDLRDNHGGVLEQAIRVADLFLERGTIVTLSGPRIRPEAVPARWYRSVTSAPLVVLVNQGTASAAEVVAGALRWNHRAVVLGQPTFGKDSIQSVFPLAGGHALKITVARYRLAGQPRGAGSRVMPHLVLRPVRLGGPLDSPHGLLATAFESMGEAGDTPNGQRELPYLVASSALHAAAPGRSGAEPPEADAALKIARGLLRRNAPQGAGALLGNTLNWAQQQQRRQDRAITERLRTLGSPAGIPAEEGPASTGVDWSSGTGLEGGAAQIVGAALAIGQPGGAHWQPLAPNDPIPAGVQLRITLAVRNGGTAAMHRLLVLAQSETPWLDGLEFAVGRVDAHRTAYATVTLPVPQDLPQGVEAMVLRMVDGRGRRLHTTHLLLPLAPGPEARLELALASFDDGQGGSRGNGDGRLQAGERVALSVRLRNVGAGPTGAGRYWLSGTDGSHLRALRTWAAFLPLRPGGREGTDLLVVAGDALGFATLPLELNVMDDRQGLTLLQYALPLAAGRTLPQLAVQPPELRMEVPEATADAPAVRLRGRILDQDGLQDVSIYSNDRKHFYAAGANQQTDLALSVRIPLAPGRNRIRIVARNHAGLASTRNYVLWRGPDGIERRLPPRPAGT